MKGQTLAGGPHGRAGRSAGAKRKRYCRRCKSRVSRSAGKCGYCGERQLNVTSPALFAFAGFVLLFFFGRLMGWF